MFERDFYGFTGRLEVQLAPAPCPVVPDSNLQTTRDNRNFEGQRRRAELATIRSKRGQAV